MKILPIEIKNLRARWNIKNRRKDHCNVVTTMYKYWDQCCLFNPHTIPLFSFTYKKSKANRGKVTPCFHG